LSLLLTALCAGAIAQPNAENARVPFAIREAAPGVFVHFGRALAVDAPGHDDIANIGFVVGKTCVAVIDTGGSTGIGRALRRRIKELTKVPICYVINTHVHFDHVLGNLAFVPDHPTFVGHARLADAMVRSRQYFVTQFAGDLDQPPSIAQIIGPDRLVQDALVLDLGGRHLNLRAWRSAHSDCDLTVLDEDSGTLWTGDLLFRGRLPVIDGDIDGWLAVIDVLGQLHVSRAIPGHGPMTSRLASALVPEQRYLRALLDGVRRSLGEGKSMQDAMAHVAESEKSQWELWEQTHPRNVARVYEQMEWE
jgi:quinoprotein relay system zinc metallohydrolase 2